MSFGGGGGGALPNHEHTNIALDGGPLDFVNTTIASLSAGSTTFSSGAALQELVIGNPGDALVVNGAGTAPEWGTVGGAGSMVFLTKTTASGSSATLDSGSLTAYEEYFFTLTAGDAGSGNNYQMRFNSVAANYNWRYSSNGGADSTGTGADSMRCGGSGDNENFTYGYISSSSSVENQMIGHATTKDAGATAPARSEAVGGDQDTANPVSSIQIRMEGSNIISGAILTVWGMAKT
jgi:hypothetical protein